MGEANYNGRQPNNTAYIKNFVKGITANLFKVTDYTKLDGIKERVITPVSKTVKSLYIPGDLFVDGSIINASDAILKKNITSLSVEITDKLMSLNPSSFQFIDEPSSQIHYGFIAEELEIEYPELIHSKPDQKYSKLKSVNYLEIIPLLVHKIQIMQKELDELKSKIDSSNK